MVIDSEVGRIKVLQIAGLVARRIENWMKPDNQVQTGQRIGRIHFGSQVSLILPGDGTVQLRVSQGQRVRAGETVLAVFARNAQSPEAQTGGDVPDGNRS